MSNKIKIFKHGSPEYEAALELRTRVLRKPLGLEFTDEELKKDLDDTHFGLFAADKIIACLTLTHTPDKRMKMRQVAVDETMQGKGHGKILSLEAEKYAHENGFEVMFCHARKTAAPFYQKLGYNIVGDEFTEVNIPHYVMEKKLL
ncbi:MAG: acetyltransferase, family [Bacteroidota bacterium]|nr:acetyltransferase, family [Bacteroidota bacterium]